MDLLHDPVNPIDRHIGRRISVRRQFVRMSPAEAAAKLGISQSLLAEYEAGLLRADPRMLLRLVSLLGVRLRYFYDGLPGANDVIAPIARRANDA